MPNAVRNYCAGREQKVERSIKILINWRSEGGRTCP